MDVTESAEMLEPEVPAVRFKILGPIEVTCADVAVRIPPGRQPVILAALLLEPNRVVSIDRLIDVVWEENPPATARTQVQICVSALRQVFAGLGVEQPIETRSPGYLLRVADGQLDSQLFTRLVAEAGVAERDGVTEDAVVLLRKAHALWRGPALGGQTGSALGSAAVRLEEAKLSALETCIDLELRLGRHTQLIGELGGLVAEHPLRERLRALLMMALYRSGRPAEALEVYRTGWRIMVDELGLEPGEELRQLEASILAEDHSLQVQTQDQPGVAAGAPAGPHQLSADIVDFTGRDELVAQAEAALSGADTAAVRVVVITGKAGIGKTSLAVHVAHRLARGRFADGQLFCNLSGTQQRPVPATDALARFLRALGLPGAAIPEEVEERAEIYRSMLAGRQMLVVLDDAGAAREVLPLLPGSGSCAVIVTSRLRLSEIPGAKLLDVDLLPPDKAMELLSNVLGAQRVAGESTAAMALVRMVGGLPLALRIVAARLAARPHWSLAAMVGRLADERRRLDELAHGDLMMRASLRLTYEGLEPRDAQLFRLLGVLSEGSFPVWAAAALLDDDPAVVAAQLERLVDMQLLDVTGPDLDGEPRYALHAIIRLFAREELVARESDATRRDALERLLGGWLALADRARRDLYGDDAGVLRGTARRWRAQSAEPSPPPGDPMRWFEAERANLVAAVGQAAAEGLDELCWDLAVCLVTLFEVGGYLDDWERTHERALAAVRQAGNRRGEAALLSSLASLYLFRRRPSAVRGVLEPALLLFEELGDVLGLAMARRNLGLITYLEGDKERAAAIYATALDGFRSAGDVLGQAYVLSKLAQISSERGEFHQATDQLSVALDMCRDVGGRRVETMVLFRLGENLMRQHKFEEADLVLGTVLELVRAQGDLDGEGIVLFALGRVRFTLGRRAEARQLLRGSIAVRERILDYVGAARVRLELAPMLAEQGDQGEAIELATSAVTTFGERKVAALEVEARRVLAMLTDAEVAT